MEKTKLGISVALMSALMVLGGWIGGYVVAVVMAGYILLAEEDKYLKSVAVKTLILMVAFSLASVAINFIPNVINVIESLVSIFTIYFNINIIHRIFNFFDSALYVLKVVAFAMFALSAYKKKEIKFPIVDKFLTDLNIR